MFYSNLTDAPVSIYQGVTDTIGKQVTLQDFINRKAYDYMTGDDKRRLPCITVGGQFHRRKLGELIAPSGLIQLDFDAKDNPHVRDWEAVKHQLVEIASQEMFVAISASGKGVYCLIHFPDLMELADHAPDYLAAQRATTKRYAGRAWSDLGLMADASCINRPNGLRFISADQSPIIKLVEEVVPA